MAPQLGRGRRCGLLMTMRTRLSVACVFHQWAMRAGGSGETTALQAVQPLFHPGRGNQKLDCYQHYRTCVE